MEIDIVKGTKDNLPSEQIKINKICDVIKNNFEKFGFRPFDTPVMEYFSVLTGKYDEDDEIVQEIYRLKDRGNRKLGLRYDLTTPLLRFVSQNNKSLKKPFRRYQIAKVFRDGPIKSGRAREFMQLDGDIVGENSIEVEAELMNLFYNTYNELEIKSVIELNNNKILSGAFLQAGFKENDLHSLILSIDKLKKIGKNAVLDEIKEKGFDFKKAEIGIEIIECKNFNQIREKAKNDLLKCGIDELEELVNLIEGDVEYRINFSMSRGLVIYSGNIWEVYDKKNRIKSSIGAGGRYDNVIGEYIGSDEKVPAVGISFGLIPILELLKNNNVRETMTDILVVPLDKSLIKTSFNLAKKLRKDYNVEIFYKYKLNKAFDYANNLKIQKIAIIGKKDFEKGVYTLKDINSGEEKVRGIEGLRD